MNLIDLIRRKDRALQGDASPLEIGVLGCAGLRMNGVHWPAGARLQLRGFREFDGLRWLPREIGWGVTVRSARTRCSLRAFVECAGEKPVLVASVQPEADRWTTVRFDWPIALLDAEDPRLCFEMAGAPGTSLFLGISEAVDLRAPILALARGHGVEIGPGMNPQVLPGRGVEVRYLERTPLSEWLDLYQKGGQAAARPGAEGLWQRYIVGDAQRLDTIEAQSLDFIFSSHVFEHLANPLGTLQAWHGRLKAGGVALGVVPDANSCFDLRQPLSTEAEWLQEWQDGTWSCGPRHYERWCRYTEPRVTPDNLRERGYSIHAHYYTPATFTTLLQRAVERLGYRSFHLRSVRNNKDFTWALRR